MGVSACGGGAGAASPADAGDDTALDAPSEASSDAPSEAGSSDAPLSDGAADMGAAPDTGARPPLAVVGTHLVDATGAIVRLHGVNHSGSEYACVGGSAGTGYDTAELPSGKTLDQFATAIAAWKVNVVRLPVNEDCWLGINGLDPKYSGAAYQKAIGDIVAALRAKGMFVIFDLHWAAPAGHVPREQWPMADADHALAFWSSAAAYFKGDRGVLFDLFNEPFLDTSYAKDPWACLRDGCNITFKSKDGTVSYATAGVQQLVDAVRGAGAENVLLVPGLGYTGDLSGWLAHEPSDAAGQHVASLHNYKFGGCTDATCWNGSFAGVLAKVPLVTGELGDGKACAGDYVSSYMSWADGVGASYLGWTWNTWDCVTGPALITDYDGTPTAMGQAFKDHYAATF
jgi:hypothetical protein